MASLRSTAAALAPTLRELRRALHKDAEIGLRLPATQARVLTALAPLDLEVSTGTAATSVVAVLRGTHPERTGEAVVLLRGDMDALPITEQTGVEYAADGEVMHACGHDLHTSGLVGATLLLSQHRDRLRGDVVFMFQPGEEGWDGAQIMIDEGVLDAAGPRVRAAYGLHVMANLLPRGVFATRPGRFMAASSGLYVTVHGVGGHASRPHDAADPIVVAAELVTALQTMVTRQTDVFDPVVLTVGLFRAGTKGNIVPETAHFEGTVRTFTAAALERVRTGSVRLCEHLAAAHGLRADVRFVEEYPVTMNSPAEAEFALQTAAELFGADRAQELEHPVMGAEDFSRVLAVVGGAYLFLGAGAGDDHHTTPGNHSARARFDDSVLPDAALLLAELAIRELQRTR